MRSCKASATLAVGVQDVVPENVGPSSWPGGEISHCVVRGDVPGPDSGRPDDPAKAGLVNQFLEHDVRVGGRPVAGRPSSQHGGGH